MYIRKYSDKYAKVSNIINRRKKKIKKLRGKIRLSKSFSSLANIAKKNKFSICLSDKPLTGVKAVGVYLVIMMLFLRFL